jgi:hypothetical protein
VYATLPHNMMVMLVYCYDLCRIEKLKKKHSGSTLNPVVCLIPSQKVCISLLVYVSPIIWLATYVHFSSFSSCCAV